MQFNRDEYVFLSRRGSVPPARRSRRRPVSEAETSGSHTSQAQAQAQTRARLAVTLGSLGTATKRRARAAGVYRAGVRATWTAFGRGGQDQSGGR